jgi:hypothetical protein
VVGHQRHIGCTAAAAAPLGTAAKMIISQKYADISFAISASARGDGCGLFNNNRIYEKDPRAQ